MATLTDVARRAGVAPSVVSRMLNGDPTLRIRPATRDRIHAAVGDLSYTPNHAGRSLRLARSGAIGLLLPEVTNPIFSRILWGAERAASDAGYVVLLGNADEGKQREGSYTGLIAQGRIDGLLLQRSNAIDDQALIRLTETRIPTVLINSRAEGHHGSVVFDDEAGARVAMEHLLALGHTRIAHLQGPASTDTARRRRRGFEATMHDAGLPCPLGWIIEAGYDEQGGYTAMRSLLAHPDRPTAVFAAHVMAAVGALTAARQMGIAIPEQLSLVAHHDIWFAEHTWPPLTTVRMPMEELGQHAIALLLERIGSEPPRDIIVREPEPRLIVRASTAPPPYA